MQGSASLDNEIFKRVGFARRRVVVPLTSSVERTDHPWLPTLTDIGNIQPDPNSSLCEWTNLSRGPIGQIPRGPQLQQVWMEQGESARDPLQARLAAQRRWWSIGGWIFFLTPMGNEFISYI